MWTPSPSIAPMPVMALFRRSELQASKSRPRDRLPRGPSLKGLGVLQLGFSRDDGNLISETMHGLGARNVARSEQVYPLGLGKPGALRYDGIVVNLDRYTDLEMGVDRLLRFRRACPSCFVVMATADVASDDFGLHRRAICDSTLRLPLSASRLAEALEAAMVNHRTIAA
jgi:hypothetical protein